MLCIDRLSFLQDSPLNIFFIRVTEKSDSRVVRSYRNMRMKSWSMPSLYFVR